LGRRCQRRHRGGQQSEAA